MMKKIAAILLLVIFTVMVCACSLAHSNEEYVSKSEESSLVEEPEKRPEKECFGSVGVYSISNESFIRSCEKVGDLSELLENEYYSFVMYLKYNGEGTLHWESMSVVVDDNEAWHWSAGSLLSGYGTDFHIYYSNMQKVVEQGSHKVTWYMDGQEIFSDTFVITKDMDWSSVYDMPSKEEIAAYTNPTNKRSPYVSGWFDLPEDVRYTEYVVDFKADYLPVGTYCCLGNWIMDYSSLEAQYESVSTEYGISGYAGFQSIDGSKKVSIMSFWDIYCKDSKGDQITIRAQRVYPESTEHSEEFAGEGVGVHCTQSYEWEENHWYRMHLRCVTSEITGNTVVEQWVCDMETGQYTLLCSYDIGVKNSAFKGSIAIFLENYLTEYAGEIRTMEVANPMYRDADSGEWCSIDGITVYPDGGALSLGYVGGYKYGTFENRLWIITDGVGTGTQGPEYFTINN